MTDAKCPLCGCRRFYVKHPDDAYELYEFECRDGEACFDADMDLENCPEINDGTETFCNACAWHDKFRTIR